MTSHISGYEMMLNSIYTLRYDRQFIFQLSYDADTQILTLLIEATNDNIHSIIYHEGTEEKQSRRLLTAETRINPWSVHVGYVVAKEALRQVFLRIFRPSTVCVQCQASHSPSFTLLTYL